MGNHFQVDKGDDFVDSGMTLITETDSDRYLDAAARQKRSKKKEELYPVPENRLDRPCGGAGGFDDFVERWAE
jgi:hypothetical protein